MSWDKITIMSSDINAVIDTLESLNISYKLTTLKKVKGLGINDDETQLYAIRRLEYQGIVIIEKMIRTSDCDTNDCVTSFRMNLKDEPRVWEPEVTIKNGEN